MIHLRASAKLNLYLRVLGRRPDGYHELETIFERIDLSDELTIEPQPASLSLTCSDPSLSCGEDNLVLKAGRLLQTTCGVLAGARVHLTKRIPIAAGLGGGSSDAAATLRGLSALWRLRLNQERLRSFAAQLGADVPFFLEEAPFAIGRGRGDVCEPLAGGQRFAHVLVYPGVPLSTREVFQGARFEPLMGAQPGRRRSRLSSVGGFDLTARRPPSTMLVHALRNGSLSELATGLWNDLEPEAIRRCPVIARLLSALHELGCLGVRMSGSGPAVFGLCHDLSHAHDVAARLRSCAEASWRIEVVRTAGTSLMGDDS